jgi:hypothetical protein
VELDVLMSSAVKYPWGEIVTGRRHRNIYQSMAAEGIVSRAGCVEGFVGKTGHFYSRAEAKAIAIDAHQVSPNHEGILNSEDLWPLTAAEKAALAE